MSRLAAYYQEDFQYHPVSHRPKQRKSAYVFYEEPQNNLLNNYVLNGDRLRNLATSEPSLSPLSQTCKPSKMTLKHKPIVYGSQLIESSHPTMQYFDNDHNMHCSNNRFYGRQTDVYDNEPLYPDERAFFDDRYISRYEHTPKDKTHKRLSYNEPRNNNHSHDEYLPRNYEKYQRPAEPNCNIYDNRHQHIPADYYYEPSQNSLSPRSPVYHQNGHWQHWPISSDDVFLNRGLLSPPSPLDSGLSSQSITSSPSLEADLFPSRGESVVIGKSGRDSVCLCRNGQYSDAKCHGPNLSRHDSGRSSGIYSAYGYPKEHLRPRNGTKQVSHSRDDLNYNGHQANNVRYGKLGLIGEPVRNGTTNNISKKNREKSIRHENGHLESMYESCSESVNGGHQSPPRTSSRGSKSQHQQSKYEKPFLVITEASEKSTESEGMISPEMENSEKSDDMESGSETASTSKSSVLSSDSDLNCSRQKSRTAEKEIRELEDMYQKCNLSDVDLLDRAERRDLPTAHQAKRDQTNVRLKRSKSDTLYETIAPTFRNPYEIPQRAPPYRRSGMPDRIADDMALRKLRKATTTSSTNGTKNTITYMLCNSHFTPTVPGYKDILFMDYPDVEFDDLSYRKHYYGKKSKIPDQQPPFGIPLRPPPPQKVFTDYLHAIPSGSPQPLCHPRGNPDVVRDDLAFRALRKDEPERMYYDISQLYKIRKC